jgi:hypothetical protein
LAGDPGGKSMPKHKLQLSLNQNPAFRTIQNWANTLEDKLEIKSSDEDKVFYIGINTSTTPMQLVIYERTGNTDTQVGTVNIV